VSDFFDDLMEGFAEIWRLGVSPNELVGVE